MRRKDPILSGASLAHPRTARGRSPPPSPRRRLRAPGPRGQRGRALLPRSAMRPPPPRSSWHAALPLGAPPRVASVCPRPRSPRSRKKKKTTDRAARPLRGAVLACVCGLTRDSYSRRRPKASKNGDPQRAGSVCRKSSFFLCAALQLLLSKLKASPVPSTHKWDVLQLCRVYCAAPQRPNGPHTLAPHSPGEFPSRFRVSSPSGRDDKTLSLSSSGFFCLVVRIQTKQRKSTFGNELELGGGGAPHTKGIFYSLSAGTQGRRRREEKSADPNKISEYGRGTRKGRAPG